jgi:hypothetical protein
MTQLNMGRARIIARAETWAQFYPRATLEALLERIYDEGPSPVFDMLVQQTPHLRNHNFEFRSAWARRRVAYCPADILFGATDG